MRVELQVPGASPRPCRVVENADYVVPEGRCPNPMCRSGSPTTDAFRVSGREQQEVGDYGLHAEAWCRSCGAVVGKLVVSEPTLFGFEEDRRVLSGRVGKVI